MSVAILANEDNAVFYCNTTDWAFGPLMPGANVAEAFLKYLSKDARLYQGHELESQWTDFMTTKMVCPFDHSEADVDTYGNGETVFTCLAKGCKAQWNLAGEEITEDEEDDELTEAERLTPAGY